MGYVCIDDEEKVSTTLHDAARRGRGMPQALSQMSEEEVRLVINEMDQTGSTALHLAVERDDVEGVVALLFAGADVHRSAVSSNRATPLMSAAANNATKCLPHLLRAGARINDEGDNGSTALLTAVINGHLDTLRQLLEYGASASTGDLWDSTPLHFASEAADAETGVAFAKLLLDHGALLDAKSHFGQTPAQRAIIFDNLPVLRCLVDAGASPSGVDNDGQNLLHFAAAYSTAQTLDYLLGRCSTDFNIQLRDEEGDSPWDLFIFSMYAESWELRDRRRPTLEDQESFVKLYQDICNRILHHDISLLERCTHALSVERHDDARSHLSALVSHKQKCHNQDLARFYRGIEGQVRCGEWLEAKDIIENELTELREMLHQDPWDQESKYDYMKPLDEYEGDETASDDVDSDHDELSASEDDDENSNRCM